MKATTKKTIYTKPLMETIVIQSKGILMGSPQTGGSVDPWDNTGGEIGDDD